MHPVLKHLIETDFADLNGTHVEGQIALSDDIINMGLHEVLSQLRQPAVPKDTAPAPPPAANTSESMPDPRVLLSKLKVEHLKYRTEVGKTVLEIKAGV
ncbi:hypothetical protein GGR28_001343 [Lewinella aquimaris]|uniref:Uncharacterized protein n=1 Tax=Neolewinella aquimaris TaxID=1835722 RepID=A0A840E0R9_9BACT|nr:hypothetical protein [Neolewinella aquimaris]MBB4078730.1 hypothetical protein [Neolewinella aquimaris]